MIGALVGVTGIVSIDSVYQALRERFRGEIGEKNVAAVKRTYEEIKKNYRA